MQTDTLREIKKHSTYVLDNCWYGNHWSRCGCGSHCHYNRHHHWHYHNRWHNRCHWLGCWCHYSDYNRYLNRDGGRDGLCNE